MPSITVILLHLNATFWSIAPIAILILAPTSAWGWMLRAIAVVWLVGAVITFYKIDKSDNYAFGSRSGGYLLAMPCFAAFMWFDPGWLRYAAAFAFAFFNLSTLMIINSAICKSSRNDEDRQ